MTTILRVDARAVLLPLRGSFKTARSVHTHQLSVVTTVECSDGVRGYGSIDPSPGYLPETVPQVVAKVQDVLGPALVGIDVADPRSLVEKLVSIAPDSPIARASVELALWDLQGRLQRLPVHRLLGKARRSEIALVGWIGVLPPEKAARAAVDWVEKGFRALKVKIGQEPQSDCERVRAVRAAVGPSIEIRVDGNEGYDVNTAISVLRALRPVGLIYCEQPVTRRDFSGLATIRRQVDVPLMADEGIETEADLRDLVRCEGADYVKLKVMKHGGIWETYHMARIAAEGGLVCTIGHGFGTALATLAEIQVAAVLDRATDAHEMVGPLKLLDDVVVQPLDLSRGCVGLPDSPGLGGDPSPDKISQYAAV